MKSKVIYDFADAHLHIFPFVFISACIVCICYILIQIKTFRRKNFPLSSLLKQENAIGATLMGVFCFFMGYSLLNIGDYINTKKIYRARQFKQTVGYITKFDERHFTKYNVISFTLNGLNFNFADNTILYACDYDGISHTSITDSTLLNIYYFTDNGTNRALRIETFK